MFYLVILFLPTAAVLPVWWLNNKEVMCDVMKFRCDGVVDYLVSAYLWAAHFMVAIMLYSALRAVVNY